MRREQRSMLVVAALAAAAVFALSSFTAGAQTPNPRIGLVTCEAWLSNPAYARDGENWVYGLWDGLIQGLGHSNRIGQLPNLDLMLDDVRSNCRGKPSSTLAEFCIPYFRESAAGRLQYAAA